MRTLDEILKLSMDELTEREKEAREYCTEWEIMKKPRETLTEEQKASVDYWSRICTKPIPVPVPVGDYIHIYKPQGDTYRSQQHPIIDEGSYHEVWVPNDFSIVHHKGVWHMVGITHPRTPQTLFRNEFDRVPGTGHEAEWQLFHASAVGERFSDVFASGSFRDHGNILATHDRPDERPEIWAPSMVPRGDEVHLVYSPERIRQYVTRDFKTWEKAEDLFVSEYESSRDINVFEEDGLIRLLYVHDNLIACRTSTDFVTWSDEQVIYDCPFSECHPESPFLMKKDEFYYLFWCVYDGKNGCYDNRTFVTAAQRIEDLYGRAPITMLDAHAPEIVCDDDGNCYLLSVYYPVNGVSAVKLDFRVRNIPNP